MHFAGRVDQAALVQHLQQSDLFVLTPEETPISYEGFGLVVLEAMSQNLPVIAAPVGCVPDLVQDGDTGIVVPARDSTALAAARTNLRMDRS